jgi:flagellar basal-body rod protein FlgB
MWDVTAHAALGALDGLAMRGEVRANNVANAETPGFRARHVEFESALRDAIQRGAPRTASFDTTASPTIIGANGNSVDLETELIGSMKDGLQRDAVVNGFNFKTAQLRVALGGRR